MERIDVLVIGGGISGLSLARACARAGLRTVVLEKEKELGGALHSERIGDGFWIEMGAHTCYNSYGGLLRIIEECGLRERLLPRTKAPWMLMENGRLRRVTSRLRFWELARALPRLMTARRAGRSVQEYYSLVLGRRNFAEVVRPLLNAVVSQDAVDFPAELLFKKRRRRKDFPRSFTLQGGLQGIPEAIREDASTRECLSVHTNAEARALSFAEGRFQVRAAGGARFEASAVALAAPPATAAGLLSGDFPALAAELGRIEERALISVAVVVAASKGEQGRVALPPLAGIVPLDDSLFSVVSRDVVPHPELRGFTFHFKPHTEASARMARIEQMLGVPAEHWKFSCTRSHTLPALDVDHHLIVSEIDRRLAGKPLAITGNFFGGLAIEDCVARSTAEAVRLRAVLLRTMPRGRD